MSRDNAAAHSLRSHRARRSSRLVFAFTLVEILISILILALGVLGLGVLFPVIIREQRLGTDATTGVLVSNMARSMLTQANWGAGLPPNPSNGQPLFAGTSSPATQWMWAELRNSARQSSTLPPICHDGLGKGFNPMSPGSFQPYGQGEWFTALVDPTTGEAKIGYPNIRNGPNPSAFPTVDIGGGVFVVACVGLPATQRLYPLTDNTQPQFVWDFAVQRVTQFSAPLGVPPDADDLRGVIFVRRIDPRIRATNGAATLTDALLAPSGSAQFRFPVGEDVNGVPTLDGTGLYSGIKTCAIEFWYDPTISALNHRDRLYVPVSGSPANVNQLWAEMKQPGQKLVDNLGNVYTVIGSGVESSVSAQNFSGTSGGEYLQIDPPVPDCVTATRSEPSVGGQTSYTVNQPVKRALWQVAFTAQIPVSVTLVPIAKGSQ